METVNVTYANLYKEPSYRSAIVSQALLWEKLRILEKGVQFSKVICEDDYQGWINNYQITNSEFESLKFEMITLRQANIFEEKDKTALVISQAVAGCSIPVVKLATEWLETLLPDGRKGFVNPLSIGKLDMDKRQAVLHLAMRFLGIPYFWGGKTSNGLDCSGYVQLLHKLAGISIRRDSPMQFDDARFISDDPINGTPGDLLFFAENGNTITHVALKLEQDKIIHARGMIKINSLVAGDADFDPSLLRDFVAVKSFL